MKKTGFLFDERFLLHDTGRYHPEVAERLLAICHGIKNAGLLPVLTHIRAIRADLRWIETVHESQYIANFCDACAAGQREFHSSDNQICADTYETALLAVGGILESVRLVMERKIDNAFCAVRPPGHHAEPNRAMGFCFFNNVAIAARYLQFQWHIQRIAIVDFDVHHGNGTQRIFEKDSSVFYYSIHEHPSFAYPGTGREFEQGSGEGYGFTKNSPVLPGQSDDEYQRLIERDLFPGLERFQPEFILVSTGFDAHEDDDMAHMKITRSGFQWIMQRLVERADRYTGGRIVSVLEGGYCLERLPELAGDHVKILLGG